MGLLMKEVLKAVTKNSEETKKLAEVFAKEILNTKFARAVVVGLEGELGAGKTTFTKGFARGLGIDEEIKSPTFILMRAFKMKKGRHFFHIDAYRIENVKEFSFIGFKNLLKDPKNILVVEWSGKVKKLMPKKYFRFVFRSPTSRPHRSRTSREIIFYA